MLVAVPPGPLAWPVGPPGGDPRRAGTDPLDPPRHDLSRRVRSGRAARSRACALAGPGPHCGPSRAALTPTICQVLGEVITAIVTPFDSDGAVSYDEFRELLLHLADNGSDGFL